MRSMPLLLLIALATAAAAQTTPRENLAAPPSAYVGGLWWDGEAFAARDTVFAQRGVFTDHRPARVERVVDLAGRYVVPPYGDAHTHMLGSTWLLDAQAAQFRGDGIAYALNLATLHSWADAAREQTAAAETIDVAHAFGGVTSTLSHPHGVTEWQRLGLVGRPLAEADRVRIFESRAAEGDGYWLWDSLADVAAEWDAFAAQRPDVVKVFVLDTDREHDDPVDGFTQRPSGRGLSEPVLREVIRRAHADGLRVFAHVETAADAALAIDAGADALAHAPGYGVAFSGDATDPASYRLSDATVAAAGARGVIVVPTALIGAQSLSDRPAGASLARAFHRETVRRLYAAGARIALGADAYGSTAAAEAAYFDAHRFLDRPALLDVWTRTTPRAVFPDRAIGRLQSGYEASLLALACDPVADWSCTGQIVHREKQGAPWLGPTTAGEHAGSGPRP